MAHKLMRLVALFLIPLGSYSQSYKPLNIGDTMPPMTFKTIFNKPGITLSISDFRGKLIILDFWNKWCYTCIEAFPKMEKLQNDFGDKIKIVLVTNDTKQELLKLFKRVKLPALSIISNDSVLSSMFPHASVPHHVWINPNGRVQFITDGYNATAENVSKVLEGKNLRLHIKNEATDIDDESDLWKEGKGRLQKYITSYSFGMTKINEIGGSYYSFIRDTINNTCGFKFVNIPLLDLYKIAFGGSTFFQNKEFAHDNRIQFNLPDGDVFFKYPEKTDSIPGWEGRNLVCYESKWKLKYDSLAYQDLQNDINRFFPFSVDVKDKVVTCYVLKKAEDFNSIASGNEEKLFDYTDSSFSLKNMPISALVESLNGLALFKAAPVINETNFDSNIDISLIKAFTDIGILKTQLFRNGFILEEVKRKIKMLVIHTKQ